MIKTYDLYAAPVVDLETARRLFEDAVRVSLNRPKVRGAAGHIIVLTELRTSLSFSSATPSQMARTRQSQRVSWHPGSCADPLTPKTQATDIFFR
jgi:hypothetical protein